MNKRNLVFRLIVVAALLAMMCGSRSIEVCSSLLCWNGNFSVSVAWLRYCSFSSMRLPPCYSRRIDNQRWPAVLCSARVGNSVELNRRYPGGHACLVIARYVASDWVSRRAGERLSRLMRGVEDERWRFVAFVRLVPLFPFNLVNYALGLTRIRLREYVLASFLFMVRGRSRTLSGIRGARSRVRAGWGNPQGSARLGAAGGLSLFCPADPSAQGPRFTTPQHS